MTQVRAGFPFNYDVMSVSDETGLRCPEEGRTHQSFKAEVDINTILRRFRLTGQLPENVRPPVFGDFSDIKDFHTAANAIAVAHEAFDAMPADVRKRFRNDPGAFVDFCLDGSNLDEMRKLGLAVPKGPDKLAAEPAAGDAAAGSGTGST